MSKLSSIQSNIFTQLSRKKYMLVQLHSYLFFITFFFFWDRVSLCRQAGVQWCNPSSLQLPFSGFKQFSCLSLLSRWDYRHAPPCLANFLYFLVETGLHHVGKNGLDLLTLWSTRLGLPKCWDYRREPLRPAPVVFLKKYFEYFVILIRYRHL